VKIAFIKQEVLWQKGVYHSQIFSYQVGWKELNIPLIRASTRSKIVGREHD